MSEFWDKRYGEEGFAYGKEPNEYIRAKLPLLTPGKILFPGEGEGRNAVYAAQLGWKVSAFDQSIKGKEKAEGLAKLRGVIIDYKIYSFLEEQYESNEFDAVALTYIHPPIEIKSEMFKRLDYYLRPGGHILFEAYSKEHREINQGNRAAGGPSEIERLYTLDDISEAFPNYEVFELKREIVLLNEGSKHVGESSVIRFFAQKR